MLNNNKGFKYIELMLTLTIIGVLIFIAAPNYMRMREKAWADTCEANRITLDYATGIAQMHGDLDKDDAVVAAMTPLALQNVLVSDYVKEWPGCPIHGEYELYE